MKNKKKIIISSIVFCITLLLFTFGNMIVRKIPFVTIPYSNREILRYLKKNYNQKFVIKEEVILNEDEKDIVYIVSPKNDETLEFYVIDRYDGGSFWLGGSGPSRNLLDTYTNALLLQELPILKNIYSNISIEEYDVNSEYFTNSLWTGSSYQKINLSFNSYSEIDNVVDKYIEIYNYIQNNVSKYKPVHTEIQIETRGIYTEIGNTPPTVQNVKDNIIKWLVVAYRENGNNDIFNIPADLKEKYPIKDIGWGNNITKVYVNDNPIYIEQYKNIKMFYVNGCLQISIAEIVNLLPELKNHLVLVDYKNFKNLEEILSDEEVFFAYLKDNNTYILTQDKNRGWSYIYKYENSEITRIYWDESYITFIDFNDEFKQRLDKYFGIKTSYDFEKEILNIYY